MEWILAPGVALLFALLLPASIRAAKRSIRRNRRMAGIALSLGMAFAFLHDPRRNEVIENVGKRAAGDASDAIGDDNGRAP